MKNKYGFGLAVAMVVMIVGAAFATGIAESLASGMHQISLTSATVYSDDGLGFFTLNASDSTVSDGIYISGVSTGVLADTVAAIAGGGTPKALSGSVSGSAGTFYVQMTDTARTTISLSFSSATAATGSWSSGLGGSGTAMDTFRSGAFFSTDSTKLYFGDSVASGNFPASLSMRINRDTASTTLADTKIAITWDSVVAVGDSIRLIVINAQGGIAYDTNMNRLSATDTTWTTSANIHLETGITKFILIVWDASQAKYIFKTGRLALGVAYTAIPATGGWGQASNLGALSNVTVTAGVTTPQIRQIEIVDIASDTAAKADGLANVDTNTSGFDTRLSRTAFTINLYDVNNNPIHTLASGQTVLVVVDYNFGGLTAAQASSIRLLHRNSGTNAWEVVSNSTPDSTNGRVVAYASNFSDFALGVVNSSSSVPAADNGSNCVIQSMAMRTGLTGILPAIRGLRDSLMASSLGRLFVSGYYAFGMLMLVGAGFSLTLAAKRR